MSNDKLYNQVSKRNYAIKIAKEACILQNNDNHKEALEMYNESNEILIEIHDEITEPCYGSEHTKGIYKAKSKVSCECARDLALNFRNMINCIKISNNEPCVFEYIDQMLSWAQVYDNDLNNKQSKSDLKNYFLLSAVLFNKLDKLKLYFDRIMHEIEQYFFYRHQAYLKGEYIDEKIIDERHRANVLLYQLTTRYPQNGSQITDFLLKQSNEMLKVNDFDGFLQLNNLVEILLKWMWENSYDWIGLNCSLEDIFLNNINKQCIRWEKNMGNDCLKKDSDRILKLLDNVSNSKNILLSIRIILRYVLQVYHSGKYEDVVPYADKIFDVLQESSNIPDTETINIYNELLLVYIEANVFDKAEFVANCNKDLLKKLKQALHQNVW